MLSSPETKTKSSRSEADLARKSRNALVKLKLEGESVQVQFHTKDEQDIALDLPLAAVRLLIDGLTEMAKGNLVSLAPTKAELTTQQGADLLRVSRPYFIKLLEEGKIPYRKVGSYRRVLMKDVLEYIDKYQQSATNAMLELVAESQEMGLYE